MIRTNVQLLEGAERAQQARRELAVLDAGRGDGQRGQPARRELADGYLECNRVHCVSGHSTQRAQYALPAVFDDAANAHCCEEIAMQL